MARYIGISPLRSQQLYADMRARCESADGRVVPVGAPDLEARIARKLGIAPEGSERVSSDDQHKALARAHHESAHAVAVVAAGSQLLGVHLASRAICFSRHEKDDAPPAPE